MARLGWVVYAGWRGGDGWRKQGGEVGMGGVSRVARWGWVV